MPTNPNQLADDKSHPEDFTYVRDEESVMRRIRKRLGDYDVNRSPILQEGAFHPSKNDETGLSLNRRASDIHPGFLTPQSLIDACTVPSIRDTCGVVELLTELVRQIGLNVVPKPSTTPGHVEIPEINFPEFEGEKSTEETRGRIRVWIAQLIGITKVLIPPGKNRKPQDS